MFDKLLEFLISIWSRLLPFSIVKEFEQAGWLRFGKLKKILGKGLHFKIPFIDEIDNYHVLKTAMTLEAQSLTTKDDVSIVVKGIIKYKTEDLSKFYTDVYNADDAIADVSMGIIRTIIAKKTWSECKEDNLENEITKKVRVEARKWGLEVESVTLSDLAIMKSYRLLMHNNKPKEDLQL